MKKGDIVRLKHGHHLSQLISGNCHITQVVKYSNKLRKTRYHISNELCMTWVYLGEIDLVSDIRDQLIESLGI